MSHCNINMVLSKTILMYYMHIHSCIPAIIKIRLLLLQKLHNKHYRGVLDIMSIISNNNA